MSDAAKLERVRILLDGLDREVERRGEQLANPTRGGQLVSQSGDFVSAPPSVIHRLRWWVRAFKEAIE